MEDSINAPDDGAQKGMAEAGCAFFGVNFGGKGLPSRIEKEIVIREFL